jgi:hypothetical protein
MKYIKTILLCITLFASSIGRADNFMPFSNYPDGYKNWSQDSQEVVYVCLRCAALYSNIGVYFQKLGTKDDVKTAKTFKDKGLIFGTLGMLLSTGLDMDKNWVEKRYGKLVNTYMIKMKESKDLNNTIFSNDIKSDFEFCNQATATIESVAKSVNKN